MPLYIYNMSLDSYEQIFQQFPASSAEEWKNKIIKDLKGDSFEKLIWHNKEGIDVLPFYTQETTASFVLPIPDKLQHNWQITERITVDNFQDANKKALHALQNGVQVILFNLSEINITQPEINLLVDKIDTKIAPVYFENYSENNKKQLLSVCANSCPDIINIPTLNTLTDEIVFALSEGVKLNSSSVYFHFLIGQNYFFEIARLRAFRWLWNKVCVLQQKKYNVIIRAETSTKNFTKENDNNNILRNTTAAMSAILGGCDQLLINSHDVLNGETDFGKRIARNIQHILYYESYFNEINDAVKGCYYIEYLTFHFAKNAWEKFSKSYSII